MRTAVRERLRPRTVRIVFAVLAATSLLGALGSSIFAAPSGAPVAALADQLRPASWAMTIPAAWLAAPVPRGRPGDAFDVLALRSGERAASVPVAYDVVMLGVDDRGLTIEVDQDDAVAIANARGAGMTFVVLLRSTR